MLGKPRLQCRIVSGWKNRAVAIGETPGAGRHHTADSARQLFEHGRYSSGPGCGLANPPHNRLGRSPALKEHLG